jgi:hypothetical protein
MVMSDILPSERVGDAWESWSTDRRRAAIRAAKTSQAVVSAACA